MGRLPVLTGVLAMVTVGCLTVVEPPDLGMQPTRCNGRTDITGACVAIADRESCHSERCELGEVCCETTGTCFEPSRQATECPSATPAQCSSRLDCGEDEYCDRDVGTSCAGSGFCRSYASCPAACAGHPGCQVCGCDGVTYTTPAHACLSGVRVLRAESCESLSNHTGCTIDEQCGDGFSCCPLSGLCFRESEPWRCTRLPNGKVPNCGNDADCGRDVSASILSWCAGDGCGTLGTCVLSARDTCDIHEDYVCGCDGITYVNACFPTRDGIRIASSGACDAG